MKIALIGYGKMGHMVRQAAEGRGHTVGCVIDEGEEAKFNTPEFRDCDVAIQFSVPAAAQQGISQAWAQGVPVVSGTTGWLNPETRAWVQQQCKTHRLLWASNFSVGVNVTMAANRLIAKLLAPYPEYTASIHEVHHIHKLDHPSGTAISLADGIIEENPRFGAWIEPTTTTLSSNAIAVTHDREGEVPGVHEVTWDSPLDTILLKHSAKSREGFATGAVIAAEWLVQHHAPGLYNMHQVIFGEE